MGLLLHEIMNSRSLFGFSIRYQNILLILIDFTIFSERDN